MLQPRLGSRGCGRLWRMHERFHILRPQVSDAGSLEDRSGRDLPLHPLFPTHICPRTLAADQHLLDVHLRADRHPRLRRQRHLQSSLQYVLSLQKSLIGRSPGKYVYPVSVLLRILEKT